MGRPRAPSRVWVWAGLWGQVGTFKLQLPAVSCSGAYCPYRELWQGESPLSWVSYLRGAGKEISFLPGRTWTCWCPSMWGGRWPVSSWNSSTWAFSSCFTCAAEKGQSKTWQRLRAGEWWGCWDLTGQESGPSSGEQQVLWLYRDVQHCWATQSLPWARGSLWFCLWGWCWWGCSTYTGYLNTHFCLKWMQFWSPEHVQPCSWGKTSHLPREPKLLISWSKAWYLLRTFLSFALYWSLGSL